MESFKQCRVVVVNRYTEASARVVAKKWRSIKIVTLELHTRVSMAKILATALS